ncbi:hypothetical protein HDU98_004510, partial [Podochytrium sp. JEL0797]
MSGTNKKIPSQQTIRKKVGAASDSSEASVPAKRGVNFSPSEDAQIARSWVNVSQDAQVGTNQSGDTFWEAVHTHWNQHLDFGDNSRSRLDQDDLTDNRNKVRLRESNRATKNTFWKMSANFTRDVVFSGTANTVGLALSFSTYVVFGVAALAYSFYSMAKNPQSADFFITARNTANLFKITWSWLAANMGSWILYKGAFQAPGSNYGMNGLVINSIVTGLPIPLVAHMGDYVRKHVPQGSSVTGYAKWRFGRTLQVLMQIQILQSLLMGTIAEYTTIGGIFLTFFGVQPHIPIIVCGVIVMAYTAVGGMFVSIITDVWQSIMALILLAITTIYLSVSFKGFDFPPMPAYLAITQTGWEAIATLGIPFMCLTLFNEGSWQRVWAAENPRTGKTGAWIACAIMILISFVLGFGGTLAYWSGRADETSNPNLSFFLAFSDDSGTGSVFVTILLIMVAVAMNEAAIDTFQNAVNDTVTNI